MSADAVCDALRLAHRIGLTPTEFWCLTPWQLMVLADGQAQLWSEKLQLALYNAWHAAAFGRAKSMPSLKTLLRDVARKSAPRDDAETGDDLLLAAFTAGATKVKDPPRVKFKVRKPRK